MAARFNGNINIDIRHSESDWTPFEPPKAPDGAPNVVYIVLDDVGFSATACYGGGFERFYGFSGEPCVDLEREAAMIFARELRAAGWFWPRTRKG